MLWYSDKTDGRTTQTTGDRWNVIVLAEKGSHTKEVLAVLGLQSVCQMSCKEREVVYTSELSSENTFKLD